MHIATDYSYRKLRTSTVILISHKFVLSHWTAVVNVYAKFNMLENTAYYCHLLNYYCIEKSNSECRHRIKFCVNIHSLSFPLFLVT